MQCVQGVALPQIRVSAVPLAGDQVPGGSNIVTVQDGADQPNNKADGVYKNFFFPKKGRNFMSAILIPPGLDTDWRTFCDIDSTASFYHGMSFSKNLHLTVGIVSAGY